MCLMESCLLSLCKTIRRKIVVPSMRWGPEYGRYLYSFGIQLDQAHAESTDRTMYTLVVLWFTLCALGALFIHCGLLDLLWSWSTSTSSGPSSQSPHLFKSLLQTCNPITLSSTTNSIIAYDQAV